MAKDRVAAANAWSALLRARAGALRAIEADLARAGTIPLSWYDVLLELRSAPEVGLRMQELAEQVVLSRTRVSRVVDELVAAGLVDKRPDPDDGRATRAVITAEGARAQRRTAPAYLRAISTHFAAELTAPELETITAALDRVALRHRPRPS